MPKFLVLGHVNAHVSRTVEAASAEDAAEAKLPRESVCWQCSRTLSVSDVYRIQVLEDGGNGDVVVDTEPDRTEELENENAELRAQVSRLSAELARAAVRP